MVANSAEVWHRFITHCVLNTVLWTVIHTVSNCPGMGKWNTFNNLMSDVHFHQICCKPGAYVTDCLICCTAYIYIQLALSLSLSYIILFALKNISSSQFPSRPDSVSSILVSISVSRWRKTQRVSTFLKLTTKKGLLPACSLTKTCRSATYLPAVSLLGSTMFLGSFFSG